MVECLYMATCPGCTLSLNVSWDGLQHPHDPPRISGIDNGRMDLQWEAMDLELIATDRIRSSEMSESKKNY